MKHLYVLLIVAALLGAAPAALANVNQFSGEWKNVDKNGGISTLQIDIQGARIRIQTWGRCKPTNCAWGAAEGTAYGPEACANLIETAEAISTIYVTSFCVRLVTIRPADGGQIRVEILTKFTDQSGRVNYRSVDTFSRA